MRFPRVLRSSVANIYGSTGSASPVATYTHRQATAQPCELKSKQPPEEPAMTIDERIEALTMNLELAHRDIEDLKAAAHKDGENIRELAAAVHKDGENIRELAAAAHTNGENIRQLAGAVHEDGENIRELTLIARSTLDSIRSLENTARAHEQRIDDLEGRRS